MLRLILFHTIIAALLFLIGFLLGDWLGLLLATLLSIIIGYLFYKYSVQYLLTSLDAKQIKRTDEPGLINDIKTISEKMNTQPPQLFISEKSIPNAFITSSTPNNTKIVITCNLLSRLSCTELRAVIAHLLARHVLGVTPFATVNAFISLALLKTIGGIKLLQPIIFPTVALLMRISSSTSQVIAADLITAEKFPNRDAIATSLIKLERQNIGRISSFEEHVLAHLSFHPFGQNNPLAQSFPTAQKRVLQMKGGLKPTDINIPWYDV